MRVSAVTLAVLASFNAATKTVSGQSPRDVVQAFFNAEDQDRWLDAARMLDLTVFERVRKNFVEGMRHRGDFRAPTVESLMQMDPKLPRAVAEYQVAEWQTNFTDSAFLGQEFARTQSVEALAALSVEEAAARWLEAKGPVWETEMRWRDARSRPQMNCAGMSDSAAKALQIRSSRQSRAVIRGATPDTGAFSYVVIDVVYSPTALPDTTLTGRGPLPRAITLRKVANTWRIEPAADLPNANGMGGVYGVGVACGEGSIQPNP